MTLRTATGLAAALVLALPLAASAAGLSATVGLNASAKVGALTTVHASTTAGIAAKADDRISTAKDKGDQEIERRIGNLTQLTTRFDGMQKLASSSQATLSASIQAQIDALTTLKAKIDADDSTTTVKADIQSITSSYRIYMLVMPQAAITAAADRALNVASLLGQLSTKLSARISSASTTDASLQASLSDMNAKIADAKVQAQAAIDGVASLKPDNGDQTVAAANTAALKAARAKVQAAQQDLVAARKDAGAVVKALGKTNTSVTASTTSSANVQ